MKDSFLIYCTGCKQEKVDNEFYNCIGSATGRSHRCKACKLEENRRWRENNRDKVKARKKSYATYNAEKIRIKSAEYRKTEKYQSHMREYRRRWNLAVRYGITVEVLEQMYERCGGACEICRRPLALQGPHTACVDHDHKTNKVRGILCRKCNQSLGTFGDSVEGLQRAIQYLEGVDNGRNEGVCDGIEAVSTC